MRYDDDDCVHAGARCEYYVPDPLVEPGDCAQPVCPSRCPHYRPHGRRSLDPDAATRAGVPLDTPAPVEPCPFAGTAPWAHRESPRKRRTRR